MKIYVSHSRNFDYKNELYSPIQNSELMNIHHFIFPHKDSDEPMDTKALLEPKKIDMIIAEVSYPATGQGIELGWADLKGIPIVCVYKLGNGISQSLKLITKNFIEYSGSEDLINKLTKYLNEPA